MIRPEILSSEALWVKVIVNNFLPYLFCNASKNSTSDCMHGMDGRRLVYNSGICIRTCLYLSNVSMFKDIQYAITSVGIAKCLKS